MYTASLTRYFSVSKHCDYVDKAAVCLYGSGNYEGYHVVSFQITLARCDQGEIAVEVYKYDDAGMPPGNIGPVGIGVNCNGGH